MRRLPAAGALLLALVSGLVPVGAARADARFQDGVVQVPGPLAGTVNVVKTTLQQAGCNVNDPAVATVQSTDGFAIPMDGPATEIDLAPKAPIGSPPALPDLDVYFFNANCEEVGSLATAAIREQCGTGFAPCPADAWYAVVTMTAGANADFTLAWATP